MGQLSTTLAERFVFAGFLCNSSHKAVAEYTLTLAQLWPNAVNISPTLPIFANRRTNARPLLLSKHDTPTQCSSNVGPTLVKHWIDVSCLPGGTQHRIYLWNKIPFDINKKCYQ